MLAEVISGAELRRALAAGFPAERIILNGPAQQWPEPGTGDGALMAAFADSPQAFARWMQEGGPRARYLGMRLRPVTIASRFGTPFDEPKRFAEVLRLLRSMPDDQQLGAHFHFASDVLGPARWREVFDGVVHWVAPSSRASGGPCAASTSAAAGSRTTSTGRSCHGCPS
jgi:hypothetical protein